MSTAAVSGSSIYQELQNFYQTRQSDLQQLGSALQSGNLTGAQQAFQSLAGLGEGGPFANSEPFSKASRADDFNAIGEALQGGNLTQAQAAFAALTGNQNNSQATSATVVNLTSTQPGATATATTNDPTSIYQQLQAYRQQRAADLDQLGQDLQAGNVSAAQQDFNTLTALGQSGPNASGQPFQRADRGQDFQAIGQALQSGDLAGAQSAFASLASTFGGQSQQAQTAISVYNSGTAPLGPPVSLSTSTAPLSTGSTNGVPEIIINLGGASGTSTANGSATPELVINLGGASSTSPEEIQINFGASGTGTSTGSTTGLTTGLTTASTIGSTTGSTTPELVINLDQGAGSSSTSPEEVTINFGAGSSVAQLSIDTTQGQNGTSAEQLTINLNQQSNYEIILNLINASATSQAPTASNGLSVQA